MESAQVTPRQRRAPGEFIWYRENLTRVSMASLRSSFRPSLFRGLESVHLAHAGHEVDVRLVRETCPTAFSGVRRWFECPRCRGRCQVLGCHPEFGWSCPAAKRCVGGWRGMTRVRNVATLQSGLTPAGASDPLCAP